AMTLAELGVERTAFHSTLQSCDGGAPMSPLCATGEYESPGQIVQGQSSYLALMMLSQLPDGQVLTPTVSGDGSVMVHGVLGNNGSLVLVIVDLRDPAEAEPQQVEIAKPRGLPEEAPTNWQLTGGNRLSCETLDSAKSTLNASAERGESPRTAKLDDADPLTVASSPASTTLLRLTPGTEPTPTEAHGDPEPENH